MVREVQGDKGGVRRVGVGWWEIWKEWMKEEMRQKRLQVQAKRRRESVAK